MKRRGTDTHAKDMRLNYANLKVDKEDRSWRKMRLFKNTLHTLPSLRLQGIGHRRGKLVGESLVSILALALVNGAHKQFGVVCKAKKRLSWALRNSHSPWRSVPN